MGITRDSLTRLQKFGLLNKKYDMLELGCQNIYDTSFNGVTYGMVAKNYFESLGIKHTSWDITACQCSQKIDLRDELNVSVFGQFDLITDYGTTEHIDNKEKGGFYQGFKNIHNLCKLGGMMIHETPLVNHWTGHGFNYVTKEFYTQLSKDMEYEMLDLQIHFAMGNIKDGGLVCCVLRKNKDKDFVIKEIFETYNYIKV